MLPMLAVAMTSADASAEVRTTIHTSIPQECAKCDWLWDSYKHERDLFVVGACNDSVAEAQAAGENLARLELRLVQERWENIPYVFDIPPAPNCSLIVRPALQAIYDRLLASCVRELPAQCVQTFYPRP
jgi:hypothetical protein